MPHESTLIVFARAPEPGKVKSRLASALGENKATEIYKLLLQQTMQTAAATDCTHIELHVAGDDQHPFILALAQQYGLPILVQQGDDLGERMGTSINSALKTARMAVLIGCDCANLEASDLEEAKDALQEGADVVLGPTADGGYYLVGMKKPEPALFSDMIWGREDVLEQTLERCRTLGLKTSQLAMRHDIDREQDLIYFENYVARD